MINSRLKAIQQLEAQDLEIYKEIIDALDSPDKNKLQQLIDSWAALSERRLYALAQDNRIGSFFTNNQQFNAKLADGDRYPDCLPKEVFVSTDWKIVCTPFQDLMGYYLFDEANKILNDSDAVSELLSQACAMGSFHALVMRMSGSLKKVTALIVEVPLHFFKIEQLKKDLFNDAAKIHNLYRSVGDVYAANVLIGFADLLIKIPGVDLEIERELLFDQSNLARRESSPLIVQIRAVLKTALQYLYMAYFSADYPMSKTFNKTLNHGKDLLAGFNCSTSDWAQTRTFLQEYLHKKFKLNLTHEFEAAEILAKKEVEKYQEEKYYPAPSRS
jgi:hypothetical protein